jgi:hypothetical protein
MNFLTSYSLLFVMLHFVLYIILFCNTFHFGLAKQNLKFRLSDDIVTLSCNFKYCCKLHQQPISSTLSLVIFAFIVVLSCFRNS